MRKCFAPIWNPFRIITREIFLRVGVPTLPQFSNGILSWIPNLIIYFVRFVSTFALVFYNDPMFALLALIGMPVSLLMSNRILKRMRNNNQKSAAMGAKMSGFNQEAFSNIQTIKAFDLIRLYSQRLRELQSEYLSMRLTFQKLSMATSIILSLVGLFVSYSCYAFGIYRVWSGAISYGTMTMFLSLSSSLTGTLNQSNFSFEVFARKICCSTDAAIDIFKCTGKRYKPVAFFFCRIIITNFSAVCKQID